MRVEKVRAQACAARAQRDRVTGIGDVAERDQGGDQEGSGDASAGDHGVYGRKPGVVGLCGAHM